MTAEPAAASTGARHPHWLVKAFVRLQVFLNRPTSGDAPEEKTALWPVCDQYFPAYADYRKRTTRDIPIFVCEPC